ncbi:MAG: LysE family transporter [Desulfobulbaceae bacterium]|nr:LysE family transporter [Desulfobulbaceae bacterium]
MCSIPRSPYFFTFLPQFISPVSQEKSAPFLLFGPCFIATSTLWCFLLAVFAVAGSLHGFLAPGAGPATRINQAAGVLIVGLGIYLAIKR